MLAKTKDCITIKVIITRDNTKYGDCALWKENTVLNKNEGWFESDDGHLCSFSGSYFKATFGWIPRKGSKQIVEIRSKILCEK